MNLSKPRTMPRTVLLVEANGDLREATTELLESLGHLVLPASRAESALRLYQRSADGKRSLIPKLLITEYLLATLDGLTLARCLRRTDPALEVVVTSTHENHPPLAEAIGRGEVAFLRKPFSLEQLAAYACDEGLPSRQRPQRQVLPFPHCERCHQPHCRPWVCSSNHSFKGA